MTKEIKKLLKSYVFRKFDNVYFLVPLHEDPTNLINLNLSGAIIWHLASQGISSGQVINVLAEYYHLSKEKTEIIYLDFFKDIITKRQNINKDKQLKTTKLNKLQRKIKFKKATLELTGKCNLNCFHCYAIGKRKLPDMSTERILKLIDEMLLENTLMVSLTGGEIFNRKDFIKIYTYLREKGFIVSMISNATMMTDEVLEVLKKYPPYHMKISLYGSTPEVHDKVTRVPGSFEKTISSMKKLRDAGINCFFGVTVFKETTSDMENIKNLADSMKVLVRFGTSLMPTLEKDHSPLIHQASRDIIKKAKSLNKTANKYLIQYRIRVNKVEPGSIYPCNVGECNYTISSDGSLLLCITDLNKEISILKEPLRSALEKLKKARLDRLKIPMDCKSCPMVYNLNN